MVNLTRRQSLGFLAAVGATSAGTVAEIRTEPSRLNLLFDQKREADQRHEQQIAITDAHIEAGTATDEVWQAQFDTCNAVDAIVLEIWAYRPANAAEQDRKVRFLLDWTKDTEASEDAVKALLTSMLAAADGGALA